MAVVTITRQYGAGGHLVGELVAARLGYQLIDKKILHLVARQANVAVKSVEETERLAGDGLMKLISELVSTSSLTRHIPGIATEFDEDRYRLFLERTIREIASRDRVVIIGRGSQYILKDHPKTIRIYLVAREEDRIRNIMERYAASRNKAETIARQEENKRLSFLKEFGETHPESWSLYHLVINTSQVDPDLTVGLICNLVAVGEKSSGG
ncbi:MAG: cytidylate kinase-like family protein [Thermodesulfobacteriota bacterium]